MSNAVMGKETIEVAPRDNLNARLVFFSTQFTVSPASVIQAVREAVRQVENVSNKIRPVVRIRNLGESGIEWARIAGIGGAIAIRWYIGTNVPGVYAEQQLTTCLR